MQQIGIDRAERVRVVPGVEGDRRHNVSFRTLFHGTAAVLCERLKRFHRIWPFEGKEKAPEADVLPGQDLKGEFTPDYLLMLLTACTSFIPTLIYSSFVAI